MLLSICICCASCRSVAPSNSNSSQTDFSSVLSHISENSELTHTEETQSDISENEPLAVAPCEHSYTLTRTTAKCTQSGYKIFSCTKCSAPKQEPLAATGHEYKDTVTEPTCTAEGSRVPVCQKCGYAEPKITIPPTGHSFDGTVCSVCGVRDIDKAREALSAWFKNNSSFDNETYGNTHRLASDNNYYMWAEGKNSSFTYLNGNTMITVSVYGFEKNTCYLTLKKDGALLEGEFPMDSLHSSDRNFFNAMNGDRNLIPIIRG